MLGSADGLLSRVDVDARLRPLVVQLPGLAGISLSYDTRGRLIEQRSSGNAGSDANPAQQTRTASLAYHASGHGAGLPSSSTNALGQSTHYGYDAARRLSTVTLPDGRQHQYAYDANGNLTSLITAAGIEHRFHHDAVDLPTQYRAPASVTTWRYNRDRDLIGIDRPGGESIALAYDSAGRLQRLTTADDQLNWSWNALGQLASVASQDATLTYQRTGTQVTGSRWSGAIEGQVSVTPNPQQRLLPRRIDVRARAGSRTIPLRYDDLDRPTQVGSLLLGYGNNPLLSSVSLGQFTSAWTHNDFGETVEARHAGTLTIQGAPTLEGHRTAILALLDRLRGELLAEITRQGNCQRRGWYDERRLPAAAKRLQGESWQWVYEDEISPEHRAELEARYGPAQEEAHNACLDWVNARMLSLTDDTHSAPISQLPTLRNRLAILHSEVQNGPVSMASESMEAASYWTPAAEDLLSQIEAHLQAIESTPTLSVPAHYRYQRDLLGRLTEQRAEVFGSVVTHQYGYDSAGRLISHRRNGTQTTWSYDAHGNRTHENGVAIATYDSEDRLQSWQGTTYYYSPAGDLEEKAGLNGSTRYHYDSLGNLRTVTLPNGDLIRYHLDAQNRRIAKDRNGVRQYGLLWLDSLRPIAELDASGQLRSVFHYAEHANVPSAMERDGKLYRILHDHLGSVRLVIDTTNGTVVQQMDYDVWGKVIQDTHPGFQPFGFAGGLHDPDTGLTRFGARDYDAETGRWTSKDPILFNGGDMNLYGYVLQDPVNYFDPEGLAQEDLERSIRILKEVHPEIYNGKVKVELGELKDGWEGATDFFSGNITISNKFSGELDAEKKQRLMEIVAHEYMHANQSVMERFVMNVKDLFGYEEDHWEIYRKSINLSEEAYKRCVSDP